MRDSCTPLDRLLEVFKDPALAQELALQTKLWAEIKRLAQVHRLLGLLAYRISPWLPAAERQWCDRVLITFHRRHQNRLEALRRLTEAFREAGLPCVALKGPLLAERFYPYPFLRPASDLDLLIDESGTGAAARLMRKLGFDLEERFPWHLQRRVVRHLNFGATRWSPRVEVHYYLRAGGSIFTSGELLNRSVVWQSPSGFEARVLSAGDEAFYSCAHAAHHAFHRLRWLYDTITIARTLTPEDRVHVRNLALRHSQTGHFVAATMAAQEFFGEGLAFDCSGFPVPWLWTRLTPRHTRRMVERVEGSTTTFGEKVGNRLDLLRMAGSPLKALHLLAYFTDCEIRKRWYGIRNRTTDPDILSRTLPG